MRFQFKSFLSENTSFRAIIKTQPISSPDNHDYHPHYELYYCHDPLVQDIVINGQIVTVDKPCLVFSAPFSIHGMSPNASKSLGFERYTFFFNDHFLSAFSPAMLPEGFFTNNCIYLLGEEQNAAIKPLFDMLMRSSDHYGESCAYFAAIVNTISRIVPKADQIAKGPSNNYIIDVLRYIYENKNSAVNADTVSEHFHVSRAKLDRDFRKFVGQSIHKTVIDCRLGYATELLRNTNLQIKEISAICGFESEYYFYAFFKRMTGKTPSAVRKSTSVG